MGRKGKVGKTTNAMRELTKAGVPFSTVSYEVNEEDLSGTHVAETLGEDCATVFKTLVTLSEAHEPLVCCIPVDAELDVKAAARAFGVKSLSMLHVRDLMATTGYIRGGCSPIGMKRRFRTVIDESCLALGHMYVSGGCRGMQIDIAPDDLIEFVGAITASIAMKG